MQTLRVVNHMTTLCILSHFLVLAHVLARLADNCYYMKVVRTYRLWKHVGKRHFSH
jgi:hypothetical protein